ncbi:MULTISPECIES: CoA transferase subunit A [Mesotoga]|uniref:3-oxoacid CoA-transferase, A subunit n=1 Tax=Mesotoga prima MesG1.Ag.4.2 TaxID=660470 RepID=I2F2Q9_9BACT|nr:3-oxoacid CoA-transferase, A subunit [Mesotoga prima MesG1.Ag.4.2]MDK2943385.1 acetate CoA/acetoacetate CoA-transferase alpha subunit [Mesotoga sp.]PIJ62021.1 branched-chain amino acid dehydrogenase [Mesotoga sp. H07.pep.5.3]RLL88363.1 branched-chain amino acid dehydrogenase [Mesotoga sp. H07pep.5.4]RLL90890.1 branched-chain amino acid dehydrogenase [Mesotoga sp. HF07.pep.5.2.highcov]CCU85750.1 Acetate CoA-transferase subunit alpha [Mesotoga infera]
MKVVGMKKIVSLIEKGSSVMIGGFLGCGSPDSIIDEIVKNEISGLTLVANDTAFPETGIGKLIVNKCASKIVVSHIGTNPETQRQMIDGELEVELVPQGTLAERIRAGGVGLGGVLTPTGVGTVVQDGKKVLTVDGRDYLMELPLRADFALVKAKKADYFGNLVFSLTARNFNPLMVLACDTVLVEVEEIVPIGSLSPDEIHIPGVFVHYIVVGGRVQ